MMPSDSKHMKPWLKPRILKGNEYHYKAVNEIAVKLANQNKLPIDVSVKLALAIPTGIMDYDEDGSLVMSSQLSITMSMMALSYRNGYADRQNEGS